MKKKNKKEKIIYHEPPMKYNVALHKFEVDLPTIKRKDSKEDVQNSQGTITIILIIVLLIVIFLFLKYRIT